MAADFPTVEAIVEIPWKPEQVQIRPGDGGPSAWTGSRFSAVHYPGDYGFIPETRCGDGDPLDVLILVEEPTFPGCRVRVRPIDERGTDEKVLGVPVADPRFAEVADLGDVPRHWLAEVENFFESYKTLEGKTVTAEGWKGSAEAQLVLKRHWCG